MPKKKPKETPEQYAARRHRTARLEELRVELAKRFPAAIAAKEEPKKPLVVGVVHDMLARCPDLPRKPLRNFMQHYTRKPTYQAALAAEGAMRVDLDGKPQELVADDHRNFAAHKLAKRQEWLDRRPRRETPAQAAP